MAKKITPSLTKNKYNIYYKLYQILIQLYNMILEYN